MKTKSKLIFEKVRRIYPKADVIQWDGEWLRRKVDVSLAVPYTKRHKHRQFGKSLQKRLGDNFRLEFTCPASKTKEGRTEFRVCALFTFNPKRK